MSESQLLHDLRQEFGRLKNGRLLRFHVGAARDADGRLIRFGVPGFPDLAGILGSSETCDQCGHIVRAQRGRWIGIEAKSEDGRVRPEQTAFHGMVRRYGGEIAVVRTLDEARDAMRSWGAEW